MTCMDCGAPADGALCEQCAPAPEPKPATSQAARHLGATILRLNRLLGIAPSGVTPAVWGEARADLAEYRTLCRLEVKTL